MSGRGGVKALGWSGKLERDGAGALDGAVALDDAVALNGAVALGGKRAELQ